MHLKEHSEYSHMAIAVESVLKTKSLTGCNGLPGLDLQDRGAASEN